MVTGEFEGGGVTSVSCASAGNCSAGGSYEDKHGNGRSFVVSQVAGVWGAARQVAGSGRSTTGPYWPGAEVTSVSCARAGNCTAAGY